ncbi:MAG: transposase [Gammaproteobacteria bacterium]|nr:transposase [Gammaproteobacteria bacterium]
MQKERRGEPPLTVRYPHCAGIDVGKKELYVAVAEDAAVENVRTFGTYTAALKQLSSWLCDCGVQQVAMEATWVYWIPVYELLERGGFEVRLVDPWATKRLNGRKSDV